MCGIAGLLSSGDLRDPSDMLREMAVCLAHRGPDDEGYYESGTRDGEFHIGLAHRRLSIIDLETGHQPLGNEDGSLWIVFNGEIYNYKELASLLTAKGHVFRTTSDTETILHGFEEWGVEFLERLNGIFAFAIWDKKEEKLFLARDRLGVKPLYYYRDESGFVFSSEIQAIQAVCSGNLHIDSTALAFYATLGYIAAPHSIFEEIRALEPATCMIFSNSKMNIRQYWDVDFSIKEKRSYKHLLKSIPQKLSESVNRQMVSDVPIGAFLSGGIDSSAVVAMMCSSAANGVETFSIGFQEGAYDESRYAKKVAAHLHTNHHVFHVRPDALHLLPRLVKHFGEPFADSSALATYYVSREARRHVKVVLSGDGGDELFCGYTINLGHKISELFQILPRAMREILCRSIDKIRFSGHNEANRILSVFRKRLKDANLNPVDRIFEKNCMFTPELREKISNETSIEPVMQLFEKLISHGDADDFLDRIAYLQVKMSLPNDMLVKVDRMSMAHGLEVRVPMLDHRFVEFVATIPPKQRFRYWKTKWLLRKSMEPFLPGEILWRKKQGFSVPLYYWFGSSDPSRDRAERKNFSLHHANDVWGEMMLAAWKAQYGTIAGF